MPWYGRREVELNPLLSIYSSQFRKTVLTVACAINAGLDLPDRCLKRDGGLRRWSEHRVVMSSLLSTAEEGQVCVFELQPMQAKRDNKTGN